MEGVVTHDFRFRLEEPTKKENQQVTAVKAPLVASAKKRKGPCIISLNMVQA
ncbi:hypothetical protein Bacsa_3582 [Phocaeicola salanitronis DSM 18170]|uniref:Uncharacterized protein n=1 Tax=Phocaeicola salanitronis (strain DSM 18170 / JCM 13657 / CCUG 60908 / BL78) TaxID=667015 RepID=F0R8C0_PHOSB|nr:hypothetical protein Bacsa_3582 [Phocaeicola salanitronis DSM 18170]